MGDKTGGVLAVLREYCRQHGTPDDFNDAMCKVAELLAQSSSVVVADDHQALCQEDIDLLRGAIQAMREG